MATMPTITIEGGANSKTTITFNFDNISFKCLEDASVEPTEPNEMAEQTSRNTNTHNAFSVLMKGSRKSQKRKGAYPSEKPGENIEGLNFLTSCCRSLRQKNWTL